MKAGLTAARHSRVPHACIELAPYLAFSGALAGSHLYQTGGGNSGVDAFHGTV